MTNWDKKLDDAVRRLDYWERVGTNRFLDLAHRGGLAVDTRLHRIAVYIYRASRDFEKAMKKIEEQP